MDSFHSHGDIVDCLEFDLTRCDSEDDLPPIRRQEGRSVVRRVEHSARHLSDSVSAAHQNRFAVLDPPVLADDPSCSDTESAMEVDDPQVVHRQQRLRLIWNSQDRLQPSVLHRDARTASCLVRGLARRVGFVPIGAPLPRAIRQQRWSPLNVPLMWAAAGHELSTPVLDWLITEAHSVREGSQEASAAVRHGWVALREVMRAWGIEDADGLSRWLGSQGFPMCSPGNHISARAQELILHEATARDARVALLESVYVLITLQHGREGAVPIQQTEVRPVAPRSRVVRVLEIPAQVGSSWTGPRQSR